MQSCLVLVAPSANHVYANQAPRLAAAELALCCPQVRGAEPIVLAGVEYIALEIDDAEQPLAPAVLRAVSRASATLAAFQREGELLRTLGEFPSVVSSAGELREPHRIARYAEQLAGTFHRFYDTCQILPKADSGEEPQPVHLARLALAEATRRTVATALRLLGVSAPERM